MVLVLLSVTLAAPWPCIKVHCSESFCSKVSVGMSMWIQSFLALTLSWAYKYVCLPMDGNQRADFLLFMNLLWSDINIEQVIDTGLWVCCHCMLTLHSKQGLQNLQLQPCVFAVNMHASWHLITTSVHVFLFKNSSLMLWSYLHWKSSGNKTHVRRFLQSGMWLSSGSYGVYTALTGQ